MTATRVIRYKELILRILLRTSESFKVGVYRMRICIVYSNWFVEEVENHVNGRLAEVSQIKSKSVLLYCKIYVGL